MICRNCGSHIFETVDTFDLGDGVKEKRRCVNCGAVGFVTLKGFRESFSGSIASEDSLSHGIEEVRV